MLNNREIGTKSWILKGQITIPKELGEALGWIKEMLLNLFAYSSSLEWSMFSND